MTELYAVRWGDAHGSDGTLMAHEVDHKPYIYTTVGFLVKTDEVGTSIAFERTEDGKYRETSFIPRAIILEEFSLGQLKKPKKKKPKLEDLQPLP
jgi:hypothetical protein